MKPSSALEWIRGTFAESKRTNELASTFDEKLFIKVLDSIEKRIPYPNGPTGRAIQHFLYCGCLNLDRWVSPTPYVITKGHRKNFDRFVNALIVSSEDTTNTARFIADQIKWDLIDILHKLSASQIAEKDEILTDYEARLKSIEIPSSRGKAEECMGIVSECLDIIKAAKSGSLKTRILSRIPIVPVLSKVNIETEWQEIGVSLNIQPTFSSPLNNMINAEDGATIIPITPSQWQHGFCDIIIECKALLDHARGVNPLLEDIKHEKPMSCWPQVFVDLFDILDRVIWKIREIQGVLASHILHPSDLAPIQCEVYAGERQIGWVIKGQPGAIFQVTNSEESEVNLELDISRPTEWYVRCRVLSETFLSTGETNDALFWINVATEALFEKRSKEICQRCNVSYSLLSSGKSYWERAAEIVAEQLPEHANIIKWPEADLGIPSWFTKIRYLSRKVTLKKNKKEVLSKYHIINKHRNALFHGEQDGRVGADEARAALEAFLWLEENFSLAEE